MDRLILQFGKYALVGITSNLLGYLMYLLVTIWLDPKVAISILYFVGIGVSYIGNKNFTFSQTRNHSYTRIRYFALYLIGYLLNLILIYWLVDLLGFPHQYVQFFLIFVVAILLFLGLRFWVFDASR